MDTAIPDAVDRFNRSLPAGLMQVVLRSPPQSGSVAVLGLSYRAGTGIDKNSQAVDLVQGLLAAHIPVAVYDPQITSETSTLGRRRGLTWCDTLDDCLSLADKIIIATEDDQFKAVSPRKCRGKTVIDCWRKFLPVISTVPMWCTLHSGVEWTVQGIVPSVAHKGVAPSDVTTVT